MPLVLSQNEATESKIKYVDKKGVSYQFRECIEESYGRASLSFTTAAARKPSGGSRKSISVGASLETSSILVHQSLLFCEILNFVEFAEPVPFKTGATNYLERNGTRRGYFQQGVRTISDEEFASILGAAGARALRIAAWHSAVAR